jgi:hypothetical protein
MPNTTCLRKPCRIPLTFNTLYLYSEERFYVFPRSSNKRLIKVVLTSPNFCFSAVSAARNDRIDYVASLKIGDAKIVIQPTTHWAVIFKPDIHGVHVDLSRSGQLLRLLSEDTSFRSKRRIAAEPVIPTSGALHFYVGAIKLARVETINEFTDRHVGHGSFLFHSL